jgi:transposase
MGPREKWLYFSYTLHDGARYHTSTSTQAFLAAHSERITEHPLPLYSPDYNPIEFLWRKTKKRATYNKYFKEFAAVVVSTDKALAYFAAHLEMVLELLGFTVKRALSNSSRLRRFRKQT